MCLFRAMALKIGKPRMDANEREGESDPIAVFIRVYSCPFAVEICSYRPLPAPHNLFRPRP